MCASLCDQVGKKTVYCYSNTYAALILLVSLFLLITPFDLSSQLSKYVIMCSIVVIIYADTEYGIRDNVKYYI